MAAFKRLNSDLTITNKINPLANITLSTNTVFIDETGYSKMCIDALKILKTTAATDY